MPEIEYDPGDVVKILNHQSIPKNTLAIVVEKDGPEWGFVRVSHAGLEHWVRRDSCSLYRRHQDSPLRAEDNKRFWKLHPVPKRAKGAK